jgi:hypothetical protein
MVALSVGTNKCSGGKNVRPTKSPLLREPSADAKDALAHKTSVMDVVLASRRRGGINHDVVCGLLTECLEDVSFTILTMLYSFALLLVFYFFLFLC